MNFKTLFFLILLTFVGTLGYSQDIPEKANTAVITVGEADDAKEKVKKAFSKMGYNVKPDKKNPDLLITDIKTIKNNTRVFFNAEFVGSEVILTGKINVAGQGNMAIENKGKKGTASLIAWEEMEKVSKSLGEEVKYEVR